MTRASTALLTVLMLSFSGPAPAQDGARTQPGVQPGRYALVPSAEGAIRLDTQTGEIAHCVPEGTSFACTTAAERAATAERLDELGRRLDLIASQLEATRSNETQALATLDQRIHAIEQEMGSLRANLPATVAELDDRTGVMREELTDIGAVLASLRQRIDALSAAPPSEPAPEEPSELTPEEEKELDRMMGFTERMMRRFFEMMGTLRKEMAGSE